MTSKISLNTFKTMFAEFKNNKIKEILCYKCLSNTSPLKNRPNLVRCNRNRCRELITILKTPPFSETKLKHSVLITLLYFYIEGLKIKNIANILDISRQAIRENFKKFDILIKEINKTNRKIGGKKMIVEVDESKFGRRKYNRGRRIEGAWVVGGVERSEGRKIFFEKVEKRDRDTLHDVIKRNVMEGSILYTDLWRGYNDIEGKGYDRLTVNHSAGFVNPINNVHTNAIEGTWAALKDFTPKRYRNKRYIGRFLELFKLIRNNENHYEKVICYLFKS